MTSTVDFNPAYKVDLYFRILRAGSKSFTFVDSNGSAIDISGYQFALYVKNNEGEKLNKIELAVGSGLTISGSGNNILSIALTTTNTALNEGEYYWELYKGSTSKTYLSGKAFAHNGKYDGKNTDASTVTVNDNGTAITITINDITSASIAAALGYTPQTGITFQDEGIDLGSANTVDEVDFTGSGVTASRVGNKVTISVTAGLSDFVVLYSRIGSPVSLTGTVSETIMDSFEVAVGDVLAGDVLLFMAMTTKAGTAGVVTPKFRHSTPGVDLNGSSLGQYNPGLATHIYNQIERKLFVDTLTSQSIYGIGSNVPSDVTSSTTAFTTLSINFGVVQNLMVTLTNASAADTSTLRNWWVIRVRP